PEWKRELVVERVEPGSPADKTGVKAGDILVRVSDQEVQSSLDLARALLDRSAGDPMPLVVRRKGEPHNYELVLQSPQRPTPSPADLVWRKLGVRLQTVSPEVVARTSPQLHGGLAVVEIQPNSVADRSGIQRGDILIGLHQWETLTPDNVAFVLSHPDLTTFNPLSFYIVRGGQVRRGWLQSVECPRMLGPDLSDLENPPHVVAQEQVGQLDGLGLGVDARAHEVVGQHAGQDAPVHVVLGQGELQLVHVAVVADLFGLRHGLGAQAQVRLDQGWGVRLPPVAARDHVGENPAITGQLLVLVARQDRDAERHFGKGVEQLGVLDQRSALVEQILALVNALPVDAAVDADHQVEGELELAAVLGQQPEYDVAMVCVVHAFRHEVRR